jgi:chemotaxis protein histidine kinase CheA
MPCNSDYMMSTRAEQDSAHHDEIARIKVELDRLTRENDLLREMVINLDQGGKLTATELKLVKRNQVAHRKEDLARLERTLREALARNPPEQTADVLHLRLGRVVTADPDRVLEPQLGFDPDSL